MQQSVATKVSRRVDKLQRRLSKVRRELQALIPPVVSEEHTPEHDLMINLRHSLDQQVDGMRHTLMLFDTYGVRNSVVKPVTNEDHAVRSCKQDDKKSNPGARYVVRPT